MEVFHILQEELSGVVNWMIGRINARFEEKTAALQTVKGATNEMTTREIWL